jgi:hypothetical protein
MMNATAHLMRGGCVCFRIDQSIGNGIYRLGDAMEQRKVTERRARQQKWRHDRRARPDRRLNNISVEWIPFSEVSMRPAIRESLSRPGNRRNQPSKTPRCEPLLAGPFENQWSPLVDRRTTTDRRTRQDNRSCSRRAQPDRRLNNIFVEWIPTE